MDFRRATAEERHDVTLLLTPNTWREEIDSPSFRRDALAMLILAAFTLLTRAWIFGDPVVNMDEQFYFTVGDRILHGQWPFIDIWDRKPIGLFLIYAFADWAFPNPVVGYQLLAACSVGVTSCILFVLARRLTSAKAALAHRCRRPDAGGSRYWTTAAAAGPAWRLVAASRRATARRARGIPAGGCRRRRISAAGVATASLRGRARGAATGARHGRCAPH